MINRKIEFRVETTREQIAIIILFVIFQMDFSVQRSTNINLYTNGKSRRMMNVRKYALLDIKACGDPMCRILASLANVTFHNRVSYSI